MRTAGDASKLHRQRRVRPAEGPHCCLCERTKTRGATAVTHSISQTPTVTQRCRRVGAALHYDAPSPVGQASEIVVDGFACRHTQQALQSEAGIAHDAHARSLLHHDLLVRLQCSAQCTSVHLSFRHRQRQRHSRRHDCTLDRCYIITRRRHCHPPHRSERRQGRCSPLTGCRTRWS